LLGKQAETAYNKERYFTYIENARRDIDIEISQIMPMIADLGLCEKMEYVLRTSGKRLRPILVLLSAQSVGGRPESVRKIALAVEFLHVATLVHDDILDQDTFRRNQLTANIKWGIRDAVLIGDALASLSLYLSADYGSEITKILSETCVALSDGEYLDVKGSLNTQKENDYIDTTRRKCASLFKASTRCGAIAAKANRDETNALSAFGEDFGLAYQIKDDLLDVKALEGNNLPQDIKMFRATLPLIRLRESSKPETKEEVFQAIASISTQNLSEKKNTIKMLQERLESTGSLRYCEEKINQYVTNAITSIEPLNESVFKSYLIETANSLKIK
jgi:geranylgeranyl pyrophosphate synthase